MVLYIPQSQVRFFLHARTCILRSVISLCWGRTGKRFQNNLRYINSDSVHIFPYCHVYEWLLAGFGLNFGFTDHFNIQLVITLNYNAIGDFHTLQITRRRSKSFPDRFVFTCSCLVTAPTMAITLLPCSSPLWLAAPFQLAQSESE
jgi:hypothetical protein